MTDTRPPEYKCAQCYIEGRRDPSKPSWGREPYMLIYDGESLCPKHFDKKRAKLLDTPPEVTK